MTVKRKLLSCFAGSPESWSQFKDCPTLHTPRLTRSATTARDKLPGRRPWLQRSKCSLTAITTRAASCDGQHHRSTLDAAKSGLSKPRIGPLKGQNAAPRDISTRCIVLWRELPLDFGVVARGNASARRKSARHFRPLEDTRGFRQHGRLERPQHRQDLGHVPALGLDCLSRINIPSRSGHRSIKILLEARKDLSDFFRPAQVGHGIRDGVVVFEPK